MSTGPLGGVLSSAAGVPLSQTKGATTERAAAASAAKETTDQLDLKTEKSAGVGQAESDQESSDRDADGRRMWERRQTPDEPTPEQADADSHDTSADDDTPPAGGLDLIA